jgi:hypothetical protein
VSAQRSRSENTFDAPFRAFAKRVDQWLQNAAFLENASPQQLRTVLTWLARGERFCDGFWEEQFKKGNLIRALRRLQSLQDSDFHFDAAASARVQGEADAYAVVEDEVITMELVEGDGNLLRIKKPEERPH